MCILMLGCKGLMLCLVTSQHLMTLLPSGLYFVPLLSHGTSTLRYVSKDCVKSLKHFIFSMLGTLLW